MGTLLAAITLTNSSNLSSFFFLCLGTGIAMGCIATLWLLRDERKGLKDVIEADLSGLHAAHDVMAAAWQTQQEMHKAAAEATGDAK